MMQIKSLLNVSTIMKTNKIQPKLHSCTKIKASMLLFKKAFFVQKNEYLLSPKSNLFHLKHLRKIRLKHFWDMLYLF